MYSFFFSLFYLFFFFDSQAPLFLGFDFFFLLVDEFLFVYFDLFGVF